MNQKKKDSLFIAGVLWNIVFIGIGLFGMFTAKTYILSFLWILFLIGLLLILIATDKYIIIKVRRLKP